MSQPALRTAAVDAPARDGIGAPWLKDRPWIDDESQDIEPYIAHLPADRRNTMRTRLETWRSEGVLVFENVVPRDLLDAFLHDLEELKAEPRRYHVEINHTGRKFFADDESQDLSRADFNDTFFRICQIHWLSKAASRLALVPEVAEFISIIFQQPAVVMQTLTFLKSSQQPPHIDYPYVRAQRRLAFMLASWIPLEDVHPDAGPLAYYPGGHKPEASGFFEWNPGEILQNSGSTKHPNDFAAYLRGRMTARGIAAKTFLPRKGDVLLWHGNLPHEGTRIRNTALTRRSLVTHYTSLDGVPVWWQSFMGDAARVAVENAYGRSVEPASAPKVKLPSWHT
ncbi:MAG: phytanoyl-CoA dioxygenase family protein [Alphaproteobacteria bacterium]|nr:phytanoyl-CoA dioxygenase family protein [Alphaproteobacteria bacterium]